MNLFKEMAQDLQSVLGRTMTECEPAINKASSWIARAVKGGSTLFTCGNGGSGADAAHLTEELVGKFYGVRNPLRSICLNADAISMTCIANDFGWEQVFARQIEAFGTPGDILVCFSTSGESRNVLVAVKAALEKGLYCIHIGGQEPGSIGRGADVSILVPSGSTARVQEVHTLILHYFMECVEAELESMNHNSTEGD